jgi:putative flavoprotein involved in K+ transport
MEGARSHDVVVVGAGQAGLALGYFLRQKGRDFVVVDRAPSVGSAWRERWDSLTLFTPRHFDSLPGMPFPGDPQGYPSRDEVIAYLEQYAETFELPIELSTEVKGLSRANGRFRLEIPNGVIEADQVVVATGPFQEPFVPPLAADLDPEMFQTHSVGYRSPAGVPGESVLVVGGGNTGFQIAEELAATRATQLSVGSRQTPLPQRVLGRDLFWWLTTSRLFSTTADSRLGSRLRDRDTLIGSSPRRLRRRGVVMRPRAVEAEGGRIRFEDGAETEVAAVVWATGWRPDYSWIQLPAFDEDGRLRHRRGVTEVPGLYFLGLTWQHTRGSALLGWVREDAAYIADRIETFERETVAAPSAPEEGRV